ncbi:YgaP-like transmembrane domain [Tepidiforma sp.]|uniref:YgaP-like transmembrane domain n=1 Tax=Tepidiforma sp. TaxID=2682230 RepID=UPI0034DFBE5B
MALAKFMGSTAGRLLRVVLGIVLIVVGLVVGGPAGWVIAIIGLVPIAAGAANVCLIAPVIGAPFRGSDARR